MTGQSNQLHMQDVPDHILLLPTLISPEEQQKDVRYVDANQTKETHDDSTGDWLSYYCLETCCVLIDLVQIMTRGEQACYQSQDLA